MNKTLRKIDAMHFYYGFGTGLCQNCPHFVKKDWNRKYHKCLVYGDSNSEATDWRKGYMACGLIDQPFPESDVRIVKLIGREAKSKMCEEPIEGQIGLEELFTDG